MLYLLGDFLPGLHATLSNQTEERRKEILGAVTEGSKEIRRQELGCCEAQ